MPALLRQLAVIALAASAATTLAACRKAHEVSVSEMSVAIIEETTGMGKKARAGDVVCVDYRLRIPDGEEVMWGNDFCFELGAGAVIAALDETVPGMQRGGSRTVKVPAHKHWGSAGYGDRIPERTMLVMDVKLTEIE